MDCIHFGTSEQETRRYSLVTHIALSYSLRYFPSAVEVLEASPDGTTIERRPNKKRRALQEISENVLKTHLLETPAQEHKLQKEELVTVETHQEHKKTNLAAHVRKYGKVHNCKLLRKHQG